jgi:hypothetical protein
MTHDHDGHHHEHHHDDGEGEADGARKLKTRIEHWIAHNREHQQALDEWSAKSKEMGLEEVGESLAAAAALLGKSVSELKKALGCF